MYAYMQISKAASFFNLKIEQANEDIKKDKTRKVNAENWEPWK